MSAEVTDDAPLRARRDDSEDDLVFVGRSVLINRSRNELAFWRDFQNLPQFMESVESIRFTGENRTLWSIKAPAGQTVELETEISEEVENEVIGWRSTEGSQIKNEGRVTFADAPAGRGTMVTADIGYDPPAGTVGRLVAKLFSAEPNIQARHELRRFKMLMETGEIAVGANHKTEDN